MSGVGVLALGAALETYFSTKEPENRPTPPHVRLDAGLGAVRYLNVVH